MISCSFLWSSYYKRKAAAERLAQCQLVIKPLVEALFAYLKQNESTIPKSGKIKEAFTYALNQERYLKAFLEDGEVPMDNNAREYPKVGKIRE